MSKLIRVSSGQIKSNIDEVLKLSYFFKKYVSEQYVKLVRSVRFAIIRTKLKSQYKCIRNKIKIIQFCRYAFV